MDLERSKREAEARAPKRRVTEDQIKEIRVKRRLPQEVS